MDVYGLFRSGRRILALKFESLDHLRGGDTDANAEIVNAVLAGERKDEARALVIMNAAAALFVGEAARGFA